MLRYIAVVLLLSASCSGLFFRDVSKTALSDVTLDEVTDKLYARLFGSENNVTLVGFTWSNCGSLHDLADVISLSIAPEPIHVPGNVTVSFSVLLKQPLIPPIQVKLHVEKKKLFWIRVPCLRNVGSCTYKDICPMIARFQCPPEFKKYGIPCHCPASSGRYSLPSTQVYLQSIGIPRWIEDGKFRVTVSVESKGREVLCLKMSFSLE